MSVCSLISDVATVDFLLLNLLPTSASFFGISDRFLKDSELFSPYSIQSSVVNHRGRFDFWYLLTHSFHPQASDACHRNETEAASLDDSIHRFPHFFTRVPLTKGWFQMEDEVGLELPNLVWDSHLLHHGENHLPHDHVEEFGRIDCRRGNSFLFSFHCQQHSPYTFMNAISWDASRHHLGQPSFAPSDNIDASTTVSSILLIISLIGFTISGVPLFPF